MAVTWIGAGRFGATAPAFVPTDIAGCAAWYDASDTSTITTTVNSVSQWDDKSGNARHLVQANGLNQPTSGLSTLNGLNIVTFATDDVISHGTASTWNFLHNGTAYTIIACARVDNSGSANPAIAGTTKSAAEGPGFDILVNRSASSIRHAVSNTVDAAVVLNTASAAITLGTAFVYTVVADPSNGTASARSTGRVNGGSAINNNTATGTPSASNAAGGLTLGGRRNNDTGTRLNGAIAEFIIYSSALGTTDREAVESYLRSKWGTP